MRTEAYRDALEKNPSLIKGARVLDVGCGTGILSMFAARGGAAAVVGIDGSEEVRWLAVEAVAECWGAWWASGISQHGAERRVATGHRPAGLVHHPHLLHLSPTRVSPLPPVSPTIPTTHHPTEQQVQIAKFARANVEANGLAGPVTIVSSKVEQLAALPELPPRSTSGQQQEGGQQATAAAVGEQQVDVLVSEWMGYALLFESMLDSVLHARDRWLRPGGAVLPDIAQLYVAAAGDGASGLDFWKDVYGFRCVGAGGWMCAWSGTVAGEGGGWWSRGRAFRMAQQHWPPSPTLPPPPPPHTHSPPPPHPTTTYTTAAWSQCVPAWRATR